MNHNLLNVAKITVNNEIIFYDGWAEVYNGDKKLIAVAKNNKGLQKCKRLIK